MLDVKIEDVKDKVNEVETLICEMAVDIYCAYLIRDEKQVSYKVAIEEAYMVLDMVKKQAEQRLMDNFQKETKRRRGY